MASSTLLSAAARRLEGKVAVITGGASGIGECTARLFGRHGAKVVIADIQDERGQAVCRDIGHSTASYIHCNVTNENEVQRTVDKAVADHGKLDIMFTNAGTADASNTSIYSTTKSEFERVMGVNVTGVFLGIKHAARVMAPVRSGSIISTASIASVLGGITPHAYTCSKHAVVGLVRNAAVELGQVGVRVNCVSPFALATPLANKAFKMESNQELEEYMEAHGVLKGVKLRTQDVAEAVLYLGSDESKYVSGHNLVIDGAYSMVNCSIPTYKYQA